MHRPTDPDPFVRWLDDHRDSVLLTLVALWVFVFAWWAAAPLDMIP